MKKLVLSLAVVFSVSLCSCGNGNKAEEAIDTVAAEPVVVEEVVEAVADTVAADTVAVVEAAEAVVAE